MAMMLSCIWLCNPMDYSPPGSSVHVIFLLQGIFPIQGLNLGLLSPSLTHGFFTSNYNGTIDDSIQQMTYWLTGHTCLLLLGPLPAHNEKGFVKIRFLVSLSLLEQEDSEFGNWLVRPLSWGILLLHNFYVKGMCQTYSGIKDFSQREFVCLVFYSRVCHVMYLRSVERSTLFLLDCSPLKYR